MAILRDHPDAVCEMKLRENLNQLHDHIEVALAMTSNLSCALTFVMKAPDVEKTEILAGRNEVGNFSDFSDASIAVRTASEKILALQFSINNILSKLDV